MPRPELREAWHEPAQTERRQSIDPEDGTGRLSPPIPMPPCRASNAIERRPDLLQQGRAGWRQHNPTVEALEQDRGTEPVLQQGHMPADRAVRHPEFERRILEAAMASSGLERANRIQRRQEAFVWH